jgi:hypothetical protein
MFETLKMITDDLSPLVIIFMAFIVMILLVSIYAAVRLDKLLSLIQKQHDFEQVKKEVEAELPNRLSLLHSNRTYNTIQANVILEFT